MAKTLQFRDGSEDGPTGKHLLAVTHEAHRRLAPDQAEGVVAEVRDHLSMQVETEVMNGIARPVAERQAVAGFGSAGRFVRGVSQALHDTHRAYVARQVTFAIAAVTLASVLLFACRFGASWHASRNMPWLFFVFPAIAVAVGSWMGWRAMPRRYALLGGGFVLALVLWTGFDTVTLPPLPGASVAPWEYAYPTQYSRSDMRRSAVTATLWRDMARQDVEKLEAGMKAFGVARRMRAADPLLYEARAQIALWDNTTKVATLMQRNPVLARTMTPQYEAQIHRVQAQIAAMQADIARGEAQLARTEVPKEFRTADGGYIAPLTYVGYASWQNAFVGVPRQSVQRGTYQSAEEYARHYQQAVAQTRPVQLRTFLQARRRWMDNGARWLAIRKAELAYRERMLESCRRVEATPFGFNVNAVTRLPWRVLLPLPVCLVLLNTVPALLARQTRRVWDSWVWRIRSMA